MGEKETYIVEYWDKEKDKFVVLFKTHTQMYAEVNAEVHSNSRKVFVRVKQNGKVICSFGEKL